MRNLTAAVVPPAKSAAVWLGRAVWNLPRNILILLLLAYRKVISPLYGQVCRFFPSCSAYALEAITVHGAVKGTAETLGFHPQAAKPAAIKIASIKVEIVFFILFVSLNI